MTDTQQETDAELVRLRVMTFNRWLASNGFRLVDTRTGLPPAQVSYLLEALMANLDEGLP